MLDSDDRGLLIEERRRRIRELLREEGRVTVDSLSARFGTSLVTIRADLAALEAAGALMRTHGGALPLSEDSDDSLGVKQLQHHAEKVRIANAAVALIREGETIILDSGTTTAEIARAIRKVDLKSINVITNALNVAALLMDVPSVRLIMPGGILRRESNSLSGHLAEAALANLQADRLYLGADGIDPRDRRDDASSAGGGAQRAHDPDFPPGRGGCRFLQAHPPQHLPDRESRGNSTS